VQPSPELGNQIYFKPKNSIRNEPSAELEDKALGKPKDELSAELKYRSWWS